jgi:hypothetical protein
VPVGPVEGATLADIVRTSGRLFVVEMDYDLHRGEAFDGPGARWARSHCNVDFRVLTRVVLVVVSNCRTVAG